MTLTENARAVTDYSEDITDELRERRAGKVFSLGDIRLYECPLSYLAADTALLMRAVYVMDGTGHLFHSGGLGSQPYWLIEAYEIFKSECASYNRDKDNGR